MTEFSIDRRRLVAGTAFATLFATLPAAAQDKPMTPWAWTDATAWVAGWAMLTGPTTAGPPIVATGSAE